MLHEQKTFGRYICPFIVAIDWLLDLSSHMWLDRLVGFSQVVRDLSVGLSCPFHCSGSILLPFVAGLSVGCVLGIVLSLGLAFCFLIYLPNPGLAPSPGNHLVPSASSVIRRRLAGYVVHE